MVFPLLFIQSINDLCTTNHKFLINLYENDVSDLISASNSELSSKRVTKYVWCVKILNTQKTDLVAFVAKGLCSGNRILQFFC